MKFHHTIVKSWNDYPYRMILPIVCLALIIMIAFYVNGSTTAEDDLGGPAQFGQFGDYIGGVLNPIFGFLTVLLLIGTAHHSRKELDLSMRALHEQTKIAGHARDLNNAIALWGHLAQITTEVRGKLALKGLTSSERELLEKQLKETEPALASMGAILNGEKNRLIRTYSGPTVTQMPPNPNNVKLNSTQ